MTLRRRYEWAANALVVGFAYLPVLLAAPGLATADTKDYLYIDPAHLTSTAATMWDPNTALGTVTHQNIGYLFPMGPFFWALHNLGIAVWVQQRLWLGCLLCLAGLGIVYLARTIGLRGPGQTVAAFAYMASPYILQYTGRISGILLPWAGLPLMVAFVIRAVRHGGWRYPALFAIVVAAVGGINATSLLYAGLAPALWLPYAVWVSHETTWRRAGAVLVKVGGLTALVSLWWAAGLAVEGAYGINVLKYTETVPAVAETSLASEVLRGLGYWYFYGSDRIGPWMPAAVSYTQQLWLIAASFAVPLLAAVGAVFVRWRNRAYFVGILVVGLVLSVGTHPFKHPSPVGGLLKTFMTDTTAGLALRSTDRATPLVILGLAVLLGSGVTGLYRRTRTLGSASGLVAVGVVLAANPFLFTGGFIPATYLRANHLPSYYLAAARYLNSHGSGTRVYAVPGVDFASEVWGDAIDPVLPGLLDRPYVQREQQVYGTLPTQDLLYAADAPIQQGTFDPATLTPIARLMSAGDVALISDYNDARYNTPRPQLLWPQFDPAPPGTTGPIAFGAPVPNVNLIPKFDEASLAQGSNPSWPPPIAVFAIPGARPILRAESPQGSLIIDGDASGLVAAAGAGLLQTNPAIVYSGSLAHQQAQLQHLATESATLVLTDSNRRRGFRWNSMRANSGYTVPAGANPSPNDPTSMPLNIFPSAPADAQTVTIDRGVSSVTASSYGNPVTFTPEDRPTMAFDGNTNTAWTTGAFTSPAGQWIQVTTKAPLTTNAVNLVQPVHGNPDRWITKVTLTFDGHHPYTVSLGASSRTATGQTVTFPQRTFRTMRITLDSIRPLHGTPTGALGAVGFAEVRLADVHVDEITAVPQDMLRTLGSASQEDPLAILLTRERIKPIPPRTDPERYMSRLIWLPTTRSFSVSGTARISALIPDSEIDQLLGRPGSDGSGIVASSSGRLPGDIQDTAASAEGGNPGHFWSPGFGYAHQIGAWIQYQLPSPITFDHLNLAVVADGRHSVPTRITVSTENGSRTVDLPLVSDTPVPGAAVSTPVSFPALTGSRVRITVDAVRAEKTVNYYSGTPITLPVGIANAGIPGVQMAPLPTRIPAVCRDNLVQIDGKPISIEITGTTAAAGALDALSFGLCGPDAGGITLGAGSHLITTADGHATGLGIDTLNFFSAAGGAAGSTLPASAVSTISGPQLPAPTPGAAPKIRISHSSATSKVVSVTGATKSFWLVLGESLDKGWTARLSNGTSLGPPQLVDGFANGWYVTPAHPGSRLVIDLRWTPQAGVDGALALSAAGMLLSICLVAGSFLVPWRRRRRSPTALAGPAGPPPGGPNNGGPHLDGDALVAGMPTVAALWATPSVVRAPHGGPHRSRHETISVAARSLFAALAAGALAAAVARPVDGIVVAVAALLAATTRWLRLLMRVATAAVVGASGVDVVVRQAIHHFPAGSTWAPQFETASALALLGILLLAADALLEIALRSGTQPGAGVIRTSAGLSGPSPEPGAGPRRTSRFSGRLRQRGRRTSHERSPPR